MSSRLAWLTPDEAPGGAVCRRVFIPAGDAYLAAFRGAFLLLMDVTNWEQAGIQTPETVSDAFLEAFFLWADSPGGECVVHHVGEVFLYGSSAGPVGALNCDGTAYQIAEYPDLFAIIGGVFGNAGAGTFRVPDLRGRMPVGQGGGAGLTFRAVGDAGGEETHVLTDAEMPSHNHTFPYRSAGGGALTRLTTLSDAVSANTATSIVGSDAPHENMPPFLGMGFFIQAL